MTSTEEEFFLSRATRTKPKRLRKVAEVQPKKAIVGRGGNAFKHTNTGLRLDLPGIKPRSGWEANCLRVLKSYDIPFQYEPKIFPFPIKRGNKAYTPDIYLPKTDEWIEIKGWFDKNSQIKMKRFKKYYPEEFAKLTMIVGKSTSSLYICEDLGVPNVLVYQNVSTAFKPIISNWEGQ